MSRGHFHEQVVTIPLTVWLRKFRFALASILFCGFMLALLVPFHDNVTLQSFQASAKTDDEKKKLVSDYNAYAATVTSFLSVPIDWYVTLVLPVVFVSIAPKPVMEVDQSVKTMTVIYICTFIIKYLLNNAFGALFVTISAEYTVPVITSSDLSATTLASTSSSNTAAVSSVLRTVTSAAIFPIVSSVCEVDEASAASALVVQTLGFSLPSWQSISTESSSASNESFVVSLGDDDQNFSNASLPMNASLAANVFINALHMSRHFFGWYDDSSALFNLTGHIEASFQPDQVSSAASAPIHSVAASALLNLLPASEVSEQAQTEWFLGAAYDLFKSSLGDAVNISQSESSMAFSHVNITDGISFDAVTFEIPLAKSFYHRKLVQASSNASVLSEDTTAASNSSGDVYYDLDLTTDCGSDAGSCVMPFTPEYYANGSVYHTEPQIKAIAICLNDNGTEAFQIDYDYYTTSSGSESDAHWACPDASSTSMWIVSLDVKVVGDALYDSAAPDDSTTTLDSQRATIVNPRKVYSLTVGRLGWETVDLAETYNAECSDGEGSCTGLRYVTDSDSTQHVILSASGTPVAQLDTFAYNGTESAEGTSATSWANLMSVAPVKSDSIEGSRMGDLLLSDNIKSFEWTSSSRSGSQCSAEAEYRSGVASNAYYVSAGLQSTYTTAMHFLFQDGVAKTTTLTATAATTLSFATSEQWVDVIIGIPTLSFILTIIGVAILFIVMPIVLIKAVSGAYKKNGLRHPVHITAEIMAQLKYNEEKYPHMFFTQRLDNVFSPENGDSMDAFKIDGITVRHKEKGDGFALPITDMMILDGVSSDTHSSTVGTAFLQASYHSDEPLYEDMVDV